MISWRDVSSSSVEKIGYNFEAAELFVKWRRGGRTSIYSDVPPEVANQAMTAWSIGDFLNESVKPVYGHRYEK